MTTNGVSVRRRSTRRAGHAVMAHRLGRRFRHVTIHPAIGSLGHVRYYPWPRGANPEWDMSPATRVRCEHAILTALAGLQAERLHAGRWNHVGARGDHETAASFALHICGSPESTNAYLDWLAIRARDMLRLSFNWAAVERVAQALLEQRQLPYARFVEVVMAGWASAGGFALRAVGRCVTPSR